MTHLWNMSEPYLAVVGLVALLLAGWHAMQRARSRRARRRGVVEPVSAAKLPCEVRDAGGRQCHFNRGHAWPCWFGDVDPERMTRL